MPVSHKLRAVFVHVPKVAGTSITAVLRHEDPNLKLVGVAPASMATLTGELWLQHMPARFLQRTVDSSLWDTYFKFAFVRNPYELAVSRFVYHRRQAQMSRAFRALEPEIARRFDAGLSFALWVESGLDARPQASYLTDASGRILLDFIGRYENLYRDFNTVAQKLNVRFALPRLNSSDHQAWSGYYTPSLKSKVREHFAEDFGMFDYPE